MMHSYLTRLGDFPSCAVLIHRMEDKRGRCNKFVMTLAIATEAEPEQVQEMCRAAPLIRESALGRIPWQEAAEAIAQSIGAGTVRVLCLEIGKYDGATSAPVKLLASRAFLKRWRDAHGDNSAREAGGDNRYIFEPTHADFEKDGDDFVEMFFEQALLAFAIDSPEGFHALLIEAPIDSAHAGDCSNVGKCIAQLERAADMELVVREAQQDMVLRVLDSGGTSAFVLNREGWVRKQNDCASRLLGEILHFPGAVAAAQPLPIPSDATAPDLKTLLPLDRLRASQYSVTTPSGRKLMIYAVPWRRNGSIFANGDELLIAWDTRADAPMLGAWQADPNGPLALSLRETFGLTRAESMLVVRLVGSNLRAAAADCGMAYETARSHIKSVFARMKLSSQSELMGLLSRFAYHERLRNALLDA